MKKILIATILVVVLTGSISTVAMAQEKPETTLPISPTFGIQHTFGLGWIGYVGLDFEFAEFQVAGIFDVQTSGVQVSHLGPIVKLDWYTPPKFAGYLEIGYLYDFANNLSITLAGVGGQYQVEYNVLVYADILLVGRQHPTYYEFKPGLTGGIKLRL